MLRQATERASSKARNQFQADSTQVKGNTNPTSTYTKQKLKIF